MRPILVEFGWWTLPVVGSTHLFIASYGLFFALAALTGWVIFLRLARATALPQAESDRFAFWTVVAGLCGSKLTLIALDWRYYLEDPIRIFSTLRSAGVLMGGVTAGFFAAVALCRLYRLPFWRVADAAAVPLPLTQAIGRIGCLMAGCCYGRACDLPWGVVFRDPAAAENSGVPLGVPLHPTQLYHFGADLLVFAATSLVWKRRRFDGQVLLVYMIFYSAERFVVELWRGDDVRGVFFGGISTSQIFSLVGLLAGLALWPVLSRRPRGDVSPGTLRSAER